MNTATLPETKQQSIYRNDLKAVSRYARRRDIDQRLADMRHRRELKEVWDVR